MCHCRRYFLFSLTAMFPFQDVSGGAQTDFGAAHTYFGSCYALFGVVVDNYNLGLFTKAARQYFCF